MTPREVDAVSLWEFRACVEGFRRLHGSTGPERTMSDERAAELGIEGF
jgi:hypothetical protein